MGGSLLPITIINGKIYFLFGKERLFDENPGWSDFGGGRDNKESYLDTAIREGGEELTGFLGSASEIRKMVTKYGTYNIDLNNEGYPTYRVHIFPIEYNPFLTLYYNNNQKFLQKKLSKQIIKNTKIFEKTQIKWFTFDDIIKYKSEFRIFYKDIIDMILNKKKDIINFISKKNIFRKKSITKKNIAVKNRKTIKSR
jgi:hypothetical protein